MKNKQIICTAFFAVICILVLGSCFSDWQPETSGTGTITISFNSYTSESARNRSTLPPWPPAENNLLGNIEYEITLSRAGESIPTFTAKSGDTISRVVSAGLWTIKIDAYLEGIDTPVSQDGRRIHYATGSLNIPVIEGRDNPAAVRMYPICQECEKHLCSCDDPKSDFYGTWELHENNNIIMILSEDTFIWKNNNNTYEYPIIDWTRNDNPDNLYGIDYQRCYSLTIITETPYTFDIYIHDDGNSLIEEYRTYRVFNKQTICHDWRWTATTPQTPCIQEKTCTICGEIDTETRHVDTECTGTQGLMINNGVVEYNAAHFTMTNVCIPDYRDGVAVTNIGYYAFIGIDGYVSGTYNTNLVSVRIGANILSIDFGAFFRCHNLTTVTFASDSKLITIGDYAFAECRNLTNIEIPGSVTTIGDGAFVSCASLTSITIPAGVNFIGHNAFALCTNLTVINVDTNNMNY